MLHKHAIYSYVTTNVGTMGWSIGSVFKIYCLAFWFGDGFKELYEYANRNADLIRYRDLRKNLGGTIKAVKFTAERVCNKTSHFISED